MQTEIETFSSAIGDVAFEYPSHWHVVDLPLPDYRYPRQVFGLSNLSISIPASRNEVWDPEGEEENFPRVWDLPASAVFVWMYFFDEGDGPTKYAKFARPLNLVQAESITEPGDGRWPSVVQRELGFKAGGRVYSIWIWEGLDISDSTRSALEAMVSSIRLSE